MTYKNKNLSFKGVENLKETGLLRLDDLGFTQPPIYEDYYDFILNQINRNKNDDAFKSSNNVNNSILQVTVQDHQTSTDNNGFRKASKKNGNTINMISSRRLHTVFNFTQCCKRKRVNHN